MSSPVKLNEICEKSPVYLQPFQPSFIESKGLTLHFQNPFRQADWLKYGFIHILLIATVLVIAFPLYYAFVISTKSIQEVVSQTAPLLPSKFMLSNYVAAWQRANMGQLLLNTVFVAMSITVGKIAISVLSAFAITFFDFPFKKTVFWMIFITLMLPVEIRIISTYQVVSSFGWLNSYPGLIIPLMASATATFLLHQFYQTIPKELPEAAQLDGAGPLRFLWSILLPLSLPNIAALFVALFIYGWKQYLWPLMITDNDNLKMVVIGLEHLIPRSGAHLPEWNILMAASVMALIPPVLIILLMQRWFIKGLIECEK